MSDTSFVKTLEYSTLADLIQIRPRRKAKLPGAYEKPHLAELCRKCPLIDCDEMSRFCKRKIQIEADRLARKLEKVK